MQCGGTVCCPYQRWVKPVFAWIKSAKCGAASSVISFCTNLKSTDSYVSSALFCASPIRRDFNLNSSTAFSSVSVLGCEFWHHAETEYWRWSRIPTLLIELGYGSCKGGTYIPEYPEDPVLLQGFCQDLPTSGCDAIGWQTTRKRKDFSQKFWVSIFIFMPQLPTWGWWGLGGSSELLQMLLPPHHQCCSPTFWKQKSKAWCGTC